MKRVQKICRNIFIFIMVMAVRMISTVMFGTDEEIIILLKKPGYWVIGACIAAIVTWQIAQAIDNSKK